MRESWEDVPPHFVTSAEKFLGVKQVLAFIDELNHDFSAQQPKS
jgi:hypothetical protein